jgi:hypothetical protein
MVCFPASVFGSDGNRYGYRMWYDPDFEKTVVANAKAMTYKLQPIYRKQQ